MKSRTAWGSAGFPSKRRWFNSNTTALCRLAITAARSSSGSTSPPSWNITNSTACSTALPLPAQPPTPRLGSWASSTQSCDRCATPRSRGPSPNACGSTGARSTPSTQDRGCTPPSGPHRT